MCGALRSNTWATSEPIRNLCRLTGGVVEQMILRTCWILFAVTGLAAAQPRLVNAKLETHSLQGPLEAEFKRLAAAQSEAGWIGYAVPVVPGDRQMCCYYSNSD